MNHDLKILPEYFGAVRSGKKPFEVRRSDRPYWVGDTLTLREWRLDGGYTGDWCVREVTYVLQGGQHGVEAGYVVLGLA